MIARATGWQVHKTDAEFDPWVASNLDTGETVFGRDLDELSEQVPAFTLERHIAQARAEIGPERWAALNAEWN
ncbi:MAG: hypothetical protein C0491_02495 [Novosphingobium sp.]|nr:hypothetical protein [Novosphingobium sp.]